MTAPGTTAPAREVAIPAEDVVLPGTLALPEDAFAVVAFAHGSGSSRFSARNRAVATALQQAGLATLLFDLLLADEDAGGPGARFDIELLTRRLVAAVGWLAARTDTGALPVGLFGASTGAAAALGAAAAEPERIGAVVSRGGRPDLAMDVLAQVRAPTLLIVGGHDSHVLALNRQAYERLGTEHEQELEKELQIVAGAGHLFEEPGALEQVAELAERWFLRHLRRAAPPRA
jgi:putative phosphoribosyl transferase